MLNVLPRAGLAYQIQPNTVIRAGFGIFNDSLSTFYLSGELRFDYDLPSAAAGLHPDHDGKRFRRHRPHLHQHPRQPLPERYRPTGSSLGLQTLGNAVTFQPHTENTLQHPLERRRAA